MKQTRQGLSSTGRKSLPRTTVANAPPISPVVPVFTPALSNELHIHVKHVSKLYTDDTGRFPILSRHVNQYIVIAYHCDSITILQSPFMTKKYAHCISTYNSIMARLKSRGHNVDLHILGNETSAE